MRDNDGKTGFEQEYLQQLAREALNAFEGIEAAGRKGLPPQAIGLDTFAWINQATAENLVNALRERREGREADCWKLIQEPAIARLVISDEEGAREEFYVCNAGSVSPAPVRLCSYLTPKGGLASYAVGDERPVRLPSGVKYYEIIEKSTFSPLNDAGEWDSRPAVVFGKAGPPLTIKSLRDLLEQAGISGDEIDEWERKLSEGDAAGNILEGLRHETLRAMELRVRPILDEFQSEIFRLPINTRLAVLGPPGSGKTTTLVKRLRQKLDFAFLEDEERALVDESGASRLDHAQSWLMFTPTELLKEYVKRALNREGVPASDDQIQTWDNYRRAVARRSLPILRSGTRKGLILRQSLGILKPETVVDQIAWFEAFNAFQQELFLKDVTSDAVRLVEAEDARVSRIGRQVEAALTRSEGLAFRFLVELAGYVTDLQVLASDLRDETRKALQPLAIRQDRSDPGFLEALARFVATLSSDTEEDLDDPDAEEDEDEPLPRQALRAAEAAFIQALRAKAVADASKRQPSKTSRSGQILAWLAERRVEIPTLVDIGVKVQLQRAIGRLGRAPADFVRKVPARYRSFRRDDAMAENWYASLMSGSDADPLEVDVILLGMLQAARQMLDHDVLMRRLGEKAPAILGEVAALARDQVLVDEATDFSPVQLACMAALADSRTKSFFAVGDFNQRLTTWGSRSVTDLQWTVPDLQIREIDIVYRQSRKLLEFADQLTSPGAPRLGTHMPEFLENEGVPPVLGAGLGSEDSRSMWLAARIREIERFSQQLPSIAVLVNSAQELEPLASTLNDALADLNIRVVASLDGRAIGPENDVRVFEVKHIKGLEFEAVFFVGVDELAEIEPELFERYIYVGATRAATYLGLTCSGKSLPPTLQALSAQMGTNW